MSTSANASIGIADITAIVQKETNGAVLRKMWRKVSLIFKNVSFKNVG